MAVLDLHCCMWAFSSCVKQGVMLLLGGTGSVLVLHGLSCYVACGIFRDQGLNL